MTKDSNGHTWVPDEDGIVEYDQGYICACGARKVVMAEGDTKPSLEALQPCPGAPIGRHSGTRIETDPRCNCRSATCTGRPGCPAVDAEEANNWGGAGGYDYTPLG